MSSNPISARLALPALVLALLVITSTAVAMVLVPGGAVILPGFGAPAGILVYDDLVPFEIKDSGGTTLSAGFVHDQVVRQASGEHIFYRRIVDTLVDTEGELVSVTTFGFGGLACSVDYVPGVPGHVPDLATRTVDGDAITFSFASAPIHESEESAPFYVHTDTDAFQVDGLLTLTLASGHDTTINVAAPITDTTPPHAELIERSEFECVCDGLVEIVGIADDVDSGIMQYTLEYRGAFDPNWSLITTSGAAVPPPGGLLGIWNTGGLTQGYYFLRLTVENGVGLVSTAVSIVWVDTQFDSLQFNGPANGTVVGGIVCPHGWLDDHCGETYTVDYAPEGGSYAPVDPNMPQYAGPKFNQTFATWDTTNGIPDGDYALRVTATDPCGHSAEAFRNVTVDNTAPFVQITSPQNCANVGGIVPVMGTVGDANLASWALQYTGGNANNWVTIATGTTNVNGLIAEWDTTTLIPCAYTLRLVASDTAIIDCNGAIHHHSETFVSLNVGDGKTCAADLNADGVVDVQDLIELILAWGICP